MKSIFAFSNGSPRSSKAPSFALQNVGSWEMTNEFPACADRCSRLSVLMKVQVTPVMGASGSPHLNVSEVRVRQGMPMFWRILSKTSRAVIFLFVWAGSLTPASRIERPSCPMSLRVHMELFMAYPLLGDCPERFSGGNPLHRHFGHEALQPGGHLTASGLLRYL